MGKKNHLPGEYSERVHVALFRDFGGRFSGPWGSHKFWSAATVEAYDVLIRPQIGAGDHEGGTEARDTGGSIGANKGVLL